MMQGIRFIGAAGVLAAALTVYGQEAAKPAFTHSINLGASFTEGNSDTRQANAGYLGTGEKEGLGSVRLSAEGKYGESRGDDGEMNKNIENAKVSANVKKTLSVMSFTFLDATYLYDDIAEIDYRINAGPGLGVYLVKTDAAQVSLEAGPSYVWERVAGEKDEYPALRAAERAEYKFASGAKVWEQVEYLPSLEQFSNYLINTEVGIEAPISAKINLRLVAQNKYDSMPGDGNERSDTSLLAGVSINL